MKRKGYRSAIIGVILLCGIPLSHAQEPIAPEANGWQIKLFPEPIPYMQRREQVDPFYRKRCMGERGIVTTRAGAIRTITPAGFPQARGRNIHQAMAVRSKQYAGLSQSFSGCTAGCPNAPISAAAPHDTRKPHHREQGRYKRPNKTLTTLYKNHIKKKIE